MNSSSPRTGRRRALAGIASIGIVAMLTVGCSRPSEATTDDPAEFFEGQTIRWVVPFAAGGGTDTTARQLAPLLSQYLPGNPSVQIENVEGGNGILGTNEFAQEDPDGLTILMTSASTNTSVLFGDPSVQFSFEEFTPIMGLPAGSVVYTSPSTGVEDGTQLWDADEPLIYGGITPGGGEFPRVMGMDLLELDVEYVWGYESRNATQIAFSQGEITIDGQGTAAYLESIQPLVDRGEAVPAYTTGLVEDGELVRDPAFSDLPNVAELYEERFGEEPDAEMLEAFTYLVLVVNNLQKNLWIHSDAPPVAIEAFEQAFVDMQAGPEFAAARDALGGYDFLLGDALERDVEAALYDAPEETIAWLADFAQREYDADLSVG